MPAHLQVHYDQNRRFSTGFGRSKLFVYQRLTEMLLEDPVLLDLFIAASRPGQPGNVLLFTAANFLLLQQPDAPLARVHPLMTGKPVDPAVIAPPFRDFLLANAPALRTLIAGKTAQFTTPRRGAYVLPMVAHIARLEGGAPVSILEVGCSVGLNLLFDQWSYDFGSAGRLDNPRSDVCIECLVEGGSTPLPPSIPTVGRRTGIDLHLFDIADPDERRWLLANLFPDLPQDRALMERALEVRDRVAPELIQADALQVLDGLIDSTPGVVCVLNSFCLYQWPEAAKQALEELLRRHSRIRPLHWASIEMPSILPSKDLPGERNGNRAVEMIHTQYRGGEADMRVVGYADIYARWMQWLG
ncbi:MAG: DUF2332 domain-containing protein [Gammaproteobacteria bacterium]